MTRTAVSFQAARRGAGPLPLRGRHADGGPLALDGQALRGVLRPGRLLGLVPAAPEGPAARRARKVRLVPVAALRCGRGEAPAAQALQPALPPHRYRSVRRPLSRGSERRARRTFSAEISAVAEPGPAPISRTVPPIGSMTQLSPQYSGPARSGETT